MKQISTISSFLVHWASAGIQKALKKQLNLKDISGLNYAHKQFCQFQDTDINLLHSWTIHSLQMTSTHKIIVNLGQFKNHKEPKKLHKIL